MPLIHDWKRSRGSLRLCSVLFLAGCVESPTAVSLSENQPVPLLIHVGYVEGPVVEADPEPIPVPDPEPIPIKVSLSKGGSSGVNDGKIGGYPPALERLLDECAEEDVPEDIPVREGSPEVAQVAQEQREILEEQHQVVDDMQDDLDSIIHQLREDHPRLKHVRAAPAVIEAPPSMSPDEAAIYEAAVLEQIQEPVRPQEPDERPEVESRVVQ